MSVFALDTEGQAALAEEARANPIDISEASPGFFRGLPKAIGLGTMRGGAKTGDFMQTAGRFFDEPGIDQDAVDAYADDIRKSSIDYWTPQANEVGTAGRVMGGFSEMVLPLMAGGGNPSIMLGTQAIHTGKELVDQGVDAATAAKVATLEAAGSGLGFKIPFLGKTLATRIGSGIAGNLAINTTTAATQQQILKRSGYEDQAKQFDPGNLEARALDVLTGIAFGGIAHVTAAKPSERAAAATLNNAKHFQEDTAPGVPADPISSMLHQDALETAIKQEVRGEPVSVPAKIAEAQFVPRPSDTGSELPVVAPGHVRFYHGGTSYEGGERWLTEDRSYAEGYADKSGEAGKVQYVDVPESFLDQHGVKKSFDDSGTSMRSPYVHWEAPEKIASGLREIPKDREYVSSETQAAIDEYAAHEGIAVSEGELTDEHLAAFQGLRSDVQADQNLGRPGEGAPAEQRRANDGGSREVAAGEPLRVYRGESRPLSAADFDEAALGHATGHPTSGLGVYFTNDAEDAARYGQLAEHHLDIRNPKTVKFEDLPSFDSLAEATKYRNGLKAQGHDGIILDASHLGGPVQYVAFEPHQVVAAKSAASLDVSAAHAALLDTDLQIPTGEFDADGNAKTVSARELMAQSEAEITQAQNDSKAFAAAATCFLSRGSE